jgi:RDD family
MENLHASGTIKRVLNFLIDNLIMGLILVALQSYSKLSLTVSCLAIILIYYLLFEGLLNQTIGKFITNTIVVTSKGDNPSLKQILLRTLFRFIPFDLLTFFGNPAIGLHDELSSTIVINCGDKNVFQQEKEVLGETNLLNQSVFEKIKILNDLLTKQKKLIVVNDHKEEIIKILAQLILTKEDAIFIINLYKEKFDKNLINELKSLTKSYSEMKFYLSVFIIYEIVQGEYPHEIVNHT